MAKMLRILSLAAVVGAIALSAGFLVFVSGVERHAPAPAEAERVDGIVVLTGGFERVVTGLDLMSEGRGRRLLISGVHRSNRSPEELSRRIGEIAPSCCIDLGYRAMNTIGNALEAQDWARRWGFQSLLIVTSDFHMPRSLAEFSLAMPDIKLIAYPVPSRYARTAWWESRPLAQSLVGEYVKFLASTARLGASRVLSALTSQALAGRQPTQPGSG